MSEDVSNASIAAPKKVVLRVDHAVWNLQGQRILDGISLEVREGASIGVIGPNGSGKTSLFNAISGFTQLTEGAIFLLDKDVTRFSPEARSKFGLGRVLQHGGIFRDMTVEENILVALESRSSWAKAFFPWSKTSRKLRDEALWWLGEITLGDKARERASSLSGGQLRLLEIVRALAYGAEVFLLDEPTAGVSPKMRSEVAKLLNKIIALGKTVLTIEHDMNFIEQFSDRIVVLDSGKVALQGSVQEVRNSPVLKEIYFGTPAKRVG